MATKKLLNADVNMQNMDNRVISEHATGIVPNKPYYVNHSIYFAESLKVYANESKTTDLIEGSDYAFAEIDSIASEMANKDCYRAIIFLTNVTEAWIDYHSYGDIVSAETFNKLVDELVASAESSEDMQAQLTSIANTLNIHINDKKPHGAAVTAQADSLALRTNTGALKVSAPTADDEAVTLGHQETAIQKAKTEITQKIDTEIIAVGDDVEVLEQKVKTKTPALEIEDFLPEDFDPEEATPEETSQANQAAAAERDAATEGIQPYHNVVRNKNGSVTVPEAVDDTDAVNKSTLLATINERLAALIDNAPEALDTLGELADLLQYEHSALGAIHSALGHRYTKKEADNLFVKKDAFVLDGTTLKITI